MSVHEGPYVEKADAPIPVETARALVRAAIRELPVVRVPLAEAAGRALAEDVVAPVDIPAFPQSSMDGYAIAFADRAAALPVAGEIPAGAKAPRTLAPGTAMRIFTGAPLPDGADTVVMQEKTAIAGGALLVRDPALTAGLFVRPRGSEIAAGQIALPRGTRISPPAVGFLAGIGVDRVAVRALPRVSIVITGDELQAPGRPLAYGQVYEANSFSLRAELAALGIRDSAVVAAPDDPARVREALAGALETSDVVLLSGGVSVGDYDFVLEAARELGVEKRFHRVRQKPGKPLYFGVRGATLVFGLPGNPASVLTCYYEYVRPALAAMTGGAGGDADEPASALRSARLAEPYRKPAGLKHFLKGVFADGQVRPLGGQESYRLHSFARANCLIHLDADREEFRAGDAVEVRPLPGGPA